MIERNGFVDIKKGWDFLSGIEEKLEREKWNRKVNSSGRKCHWFGIGVELGFNNTFFEGEEINRGLRIRGNELWGNDDWNSVLIYKYDKGVELKDHIDRNCFDDKVIIINFCKDLVGFRYDKKVYWIKDGEILKINNKKNHGICRVNSERWSISFRKVLI